MLEQCNWYFTEPWGAMSIRRGDALGFRVASDHFADLLAPGLSNATYDARWISLLSWCLKWSHTVWSNAGGGDLSRRDDQRARYAWLRPLELLWIDRTLASGQYTGQLRGRRSVERWQSNRHTPNFAMSPDQFSRYRQIGMYGAYRVILRTIPGLTLPNATGQTMGDGWTPDTTAQKLANLVNDSLPRAARLKPEHFEVGTRWSNWSGGAEARYWVEHGWPLSSTKTGGFLPTSNDDLSKRLPEQERQLLASALFNSGSIRRLTAEVLAGAKDARSHSDLCDALVNSRLLSTNPTPAYLPALPAFSRFADAAMHTMRKLWSEINRDSEKQAPAIDKIVRSGELLTSLEQLRVKSIAWIQSPGRNAFPHERVVTQLAEAMCGAASYSDQVRSLSRHHETHGGGRRWFREESGKLVPLVAHNGIAASDYRFRLRSLCLLAAQCGVAKMDSALNAMAQDAEDEEEKDYT